MNIVLIAAIGKNNEIGKNNSLIWYLPDDLKFFKEKTMNHYIIMGYNTFKSLPKLLPGRKHIVLTHRDILIEGVEIFHDKEELLKEIKKYEDDVFIIGGESIYEQFIEDADQMLLTEINATDEMADAYFPKFDVNEWKKTDLGENNQGIPYVHRKYVRK